MWQISVRCLAYRFMETVGECVIELPAKWLGCSMVITQSLKQASLLPIALF
jgi:hypothetical protein